MGRERFGPSGSGKDRKSRQTPPALATRPSLDADPGLSATVFSEDPNPVASELGVRVGPKGHALVREENSSGTSGFDFRRVKSYRKLGGEFHPGLDHNDHPLTLDLNDPAGAHFIGGTIVDANAFTAHRIGGFLSNPANNELSVVAVDFSGGTETILARAEAHKNGHAVVVKEANANEILAASTPDQATQLLAAACQAHHSRDTGDKGSVTQNCLKTIIRAAI